MNHVQISHPALVALQGRLRSIIEAADDLSDVLDSAAYADEVKEAERIGDLAEDARMEIDRWLTDPAKQVNPKDEEIRG